MQYALYCLVLFLLHCDGQNISVDTIITLPVASSSSSSTCGLNSTEEICERGGVICEICNVSSPTHTIDLVHDGRYDTYWQSSTYSQIQDGVNITLALAGLFSIDEISLTFYSSRPDSFTLYTSTDHGLSYVPVQHFSSSCIGGTSSEDPSRGCTSSGTGLLPLTGGQATFVATDSVLATNTLITLEELSTWEMN